MPTDRPAAEVHERVKCTRAERDGCQCCVRCGLPASDPIHVPEHRCSSGLGSANPDLCAECHRPLVAPASGEGRELGRLAVLFHARHRNHEFSRGCSPCADLDLLIRELGGDPGALSAPTTSRTSQEEKP